MNSPHEASISGTGLFSARPATVVVRAGKPGTGICFLRNAAGKEVLIPAGIAGVTEAEGPLGGRNTVLRSGGTSIATVEHLLSALAGLGLWDAVIRIDADELPILDGSAMSFVLAVSKLVSPSTRAQPVTLADTIRVEDTRTGSWIEAKPSSQLRYRYELSYPPGSGIGDQSFEWAGSAAMYARDIAPARTFSLEREALAMKKAGLFPHLTAKDMLVIAPDGTAIDNSLRFPDEPARHKLLDLIGDLALLGGPLLADVVAHKSSHALTHELCRRIANLAK